MINFLRRAVKSLPAQILLGLLVASFAVWGIGDVFSSGGPGAVARVGNTDLPADRFAEALSRTQRMLSQQQRKAVSLRELRESGIADATLAGLVSDVAFAEELSRLGIAVPKEAVRRAIVDSPTFQDGQGGFSQFLYQSRISNAGFSPQAYEAATRELLGQQILTDAFAPVSAPPPAVGEMFAAYAGEERELRYVRLTPDMVAEPAAPGEEALSAWFEKHAEQFREPERRSGLYLRTNIEKLAAEFAPTAEEVRAEYEANPALYTVEPTRDVEQIVFDDADAANAALARIQSGEASFADIAAERNVSASDLSLGTVTREDLPEETAEAVFATTEPGVVGPVDGIFGTILLNITDVEQGGTAPFAEVSEEIADTLAKRRARDEAARKGNAIDDLRAAGTPLPEIAEELDLDLVRFHGMDTAGNVTEGDTPPLASSPAILAEINAAIDGEERDVIQLPDGSYVLVLIEEVTDSHLPELDDVRERAIAAWQEEQRMQALEDRAAELAAGITSENGLDAVAKEADLGDVSTVTLNRGELPAGFSEALVDAAFNANPGEGLTGRTGAGNAVLLAEVTDVKPLAKGELAETKTAIERALMTSIEQDQLEYLSLAIQEREGVSINSRAVEQVYNQLGQSGG